MNPQVTDYINHSVDEQKIIMQEIRQLISQSVPAVKENFKWSRPVFSTEKDFAYLKTAKGYVTLGFMNFQKLEDKNNLLEGTGKDMRHIKIRKVADIDQNLLKKWLKAAAK
jgi:hypothetical protein